MEEYKTKKIVTYAIEKFGKKKGVNEEKEPTKWDVRGVTFSMVGLFLIFFECWYSYKCVGKGFSFLLLIGLPALFIGTCRTGWHEFVRKSKRNRNYLVVALFVLDFLVLYDCYIFNCEILFGSIVGYLRFGVLPSF